jgi:putative MATE family efflux protein
MESKIESKTESKKFDVAGHPLATGKVGGLLLRFAVPSIISMLVGSLYNIVDQVFIGHDVGILGNAATNVAFPLVTICMSLSLLLGIGGASNFNLELGKGNPERAGRIVANAITYAVIVGVVLCVVVLLLLRPLLHSFGATDEVFPYAMTYTSITSFGMPFLIMSACGSHLIRADGSPTYSMLCNLTGALLNTALDPLFMFGFGMGIAGAAWATTLSQAVSCVMTVGYLMRFRSVPLARHYFRPRLGELKTIVSLGSSACFNQLSMMCVQITMNNTLTHYGASSIYGSNIPLAAVGVITKVNMIFFSTVIGIAQGGQQIIGFNYGAGNYARVEKTYWLISSWGTVISVASFLCFQLFPRQLIALFGSGSEEYYLFAERFFRIFLLMTFTSGILPSTATFFTSIGKAMRGFLVALTKQILFLLPLILLFPRFWGIDGVMYAGPVADSAAAILAAILVTKELRNMRKLKSAGFRDGIPL